MIAIGGATIGWMSALKGWTFRSAGEIGKGISRVGKHRFYLDEVFRGVFVLPAEMAATLLARFDIHGIDALWRITVQVPNRLGSMFRRLQHGQLSGYSLLVAAGLLAYLVLTVIKGSE